MTDLLVQPTVIDKFVAWLPDQDEFADYSEPAPRVVTQLPENKDPAGIVRLTQFNALPVAQRPVWLTETFVQVEVFGGPSFAAMRLAYVVAALLEQRFPGAHDDLQVSTVDVTLPRDEPDDTFDPARPRWVFVATIFARPILSAGS